MKYSVIFTTVIALALASQLVTAGTIAEDYGTPPNKILTVDMMNEIKTAVNDNNDRITNLENVNVLSISAVDAVSRNLFDCELIRTATMPVSVTNENTSATLMPKSGTATNCEAYQTVPVPHGVTVTNMECYVLDNHTNGRVTLQFQTVSLSTGTKSAPFSVSTDTTAASSTLQTLVSNGGGVGLTINANTNVYFLYYLFTDGDNFNTGDNRLFIRGCKFTY